MTLYTSSLKQEDAEWSAKNGARLWLGDVNVNINLESIEKTHYLASVIRYRFVLN